MPYKPHEIASVLQSKLKFAPAKGHSSDHLWYELHLPGLPLILTKVSHGRKDVGPKLEAKIARQLRVRKRFFQGIMDCTQGAEDYRRQLEEDPYPPFYIRF